MNPITRATLLVLLGVVVFVGGLGISFTGGLTATPIQDTGSVPHVDPANASGGIDSGTNQAFFQKFLSDRLDASADALNKSNYSEAAELLDDEYEEKLRQYAASGGNETTAERYRTIRQRQRALAIALEDYQENHTQYEAMREQGSDAEIRRVARNLNRLANRVEHRNESLQAAVDDPTSNISRAARRATRDVRETQQSVRTVVFTQTAMTVAVDRQRASPVEPVELTAHLVDGDGQPLANQQVLLSVPEANPVQTTNRSGYATFEYRPAIIGTGNQSLNVMFRPQNDSVYLAAKASTTVTIESVRPTIEVTTGSEPVSYNQSLTATGNVSAGETTFSSVPVAVSVDGQRLGNATTDEDGRFQFQQPLPATVPPGEHQLTARIALQGRALEQTTTNATLRVEELDARLRIDNATRDDDILQVNGQLETTDGRAVRGQRTDVIVFVNGTRLRTVRTDTNGRFGGSVVVPSALMPDGDGPIRLRLVPDLTGTNLAGTNATLLVHPPRDDDAVFSFPITLGNGRTGVVVFLAALCAVIGGGWYVRRQDGKPEDITVPTTETDISGRSEREESRNVGDLLSVARETAEDNPETAVEAAYAATRRTLASELSITDPITHWEFYRQCRASLPADRAEALETLTEAFEQAAYAPEALDSTDAERAVEQAEQLHS